MRNTHKAQKQLPMVGSLVKCSRCKRMILIERALIGTDHTDLLNAIHWDCLTEEEKEKARRKYNLK